ncbi:MAG: hypothetical protein M3362_02610 [Acidobacteriota bacterium]|nr:hypothetical protein [Acidobacteriota bacterium]
MHDPNATPQGFLRRPSELLLRVALKDVGPLVAVGKPGEGLPPLGATRIYLPHGEWKDRVAELMSISSLVIIETGSVTSQRNITYQDYTEGLKWEMLTASASVKPGKLLVSFFYTQILDARSRMEEFEAFKLLAGDAWGLQIPELTKNCYFISLREGSTAEVVALPKWKQLLYGRRTVAAVQEALRPLLSKGGIRLPRLRSYMIVGARLAYLCSLASLVIYIPILRCLMLPIYGLYRLFLHNFEGNGLMARSNRLLLYHVLKEE